MGASFNDQFDQFGHWRREFGRQLTAMREWLDTQELLDSAVQNHLQRLERKLDNDEVRVAFVAESGRGKSELINALFFAHYGRHILSHGPDGSTLCPIELAYDPETPACLRLLPIETRKHTDSMGRWLSQTSIWVQSPLNVDDPEQLALQLAKVSETRRVSLEEARILGFWNDEMPEHNPVPDADGLFTIPKWRHALVNMAHPLLRQGLVIYDMPGLNAVSTGPELTVNLLSQMHAVIFLLSVEGGVTPQDSAVWNEHLLPRQRLANHLVVLNKIDQLDGQAGAVQRVREECAQALGIPQGHIVPLSALRGLNAKLAQDDNALEQSGMMHFENIMVRNILHHRQKMLRERVAYYVHRMQAQVQRSLRIRHRDLDARLRELEKLRGCTADEIAEVRAGIVAEQRAFTTLSPRVFDLHSTHLRLLNQAFQLMGSTVVRREMDTLSKALAHSGLEHGIRATYALMFERLHDLGLQIHAITSQIQSLWTHAFAQLNAEFGFSLEPPGELKRAESMYELAQIEESYLHYLGADLSHVRKLANPLLSQRLVNALASRLQPMLDSAGTNLSLWSQVPTSQLDIQLKERRQSFAQRLAAVDSVQANPNTLDDHIAAIHHTRQHLTQLEHRLDAWVHQLVQDDQGVSPASRAHPW